MSIELKITIIIFAWSFLFMGIASGDNYKSVTDQVLALIGAALFLAGMIAGTIWIIQL